MIHKEYKPDGSPDLRCWSVECDSCKTRHMLFGTADWLVPANPNMPDYCPSCLAILAALIIELAFA